MKICQSFAWKKRVGIPLPNSDCTECFAGFIFQAVRFNPRGPWTDIFSQAGQQHKTPITMITTSCCIFRGEKSFRHESFPQHPQPWITVMSRKDFPLTSFCGPARKNPLKLRPVAFSMGWLKHFPKVKVSKASGNATFSKLRLKETPKVMCCKPLLIFADMIRDDDAFVLPEGGTTWKWKTKLNC